MTTEERFERIEANLQQLTERMDKFEVALEVQNHAWNERFNQLWKAQTVTMEAQNHTWEAIAALAKTVDTMGKSIDTMGKSIENMGHKIDKLSDTIDAFVRGLQRPNGHRE
jgi:prefoldin subunit 5